MENVLLDRIELQEKRRGQNLLRTLYDVQERKWKEVGSN
jgi:hypothetical protein